MTVDEVIKTVEKIKSLEYELNSLKDHISWLQHRLEHFEDTGLEYINICSGNEWLYDCEYHIPETIKQAIIDDYKQNVLAEHLKRLDWLTSEIKELKKSLEK